ncbi:TonB-dependent receptor [Hymenobacter sp. HSC-4F20]|uniref:SusC/RagA family TonB-linked outer membrane protein n=1 Tax=Hymenobacter sp. HSC-4F20 TaxID=2864135 RepID=UPI001C72C9F9|nr:TonB-dependent receptor [Hymenobacter sp. HSC-4F20]MBX0290399.1 TonB-dependent receptor [Hymenobacter sp. HSC-4F20]
MKRNLLLLAPLLAVAAPAWAQQQRVQGVVKSEKGEALPGVTVVVKGTTAGATTDADGRFALAVPANATLRFSYIGFLPYEVAVGTRTDLSVTLKEDTKTLDDVVVIGYQAVQRRDVTGSVSSVSAQQIKDIPVNSAAEALTGRLAGVQLTSSEGTPGNLDVRVRVRGGGSITQDNSPLYIVDGIQIENALAVIAPQDIASVDVLKDASATAIYGARGANGVVIITTKKGIEGKTTISYNGFAGFRKLANKLDVLKPADYLNYQFERAQQVGATGSGSLETYAKLFGSSDYQSTTIQDLGKTPFIDWQEEAFGRSAFQQTHNLSVSGGVKGTTYALSLTRNDEDGIQQGSGFTRNLVNFRFDTKPLEKLRIGLNVRFNDQQVDGAGTSTTGSNTTSRLRNAVQYWPLAVSRATALDPNAFDPEFFQFSSLVNPLVAINSEFREDKRRTFNIGANADLTLAKGLVFRTTAGFDITNTGVNTFNGINSPTLRQPGGGYNEQPFATISTGTQNTINNSNVLDYSLAKGKHAIGVLVGEEIYQQRNTSQFIQTNFLPPDITAERAWANINQGVLPAGVLAQPVLPRTDIPQNYRLLSGFGRLTYSFDDKYLFTGTFRADGSSKFAEGNRWGYFPGASVAWRISKEDFFKAVPVVSDLKLRLSYGQAGNNRINDFLYDQLFAAGSAPYYLNHSQVLGASATTLPNPNLKWEVTTSRDFGVDLSLWDNRVQFTGDVYYNTTTDLLINRPIPPFLGYTSQLQNVGKTSNKGLELQLTGTIFNKPNFTWTATANASLNRGRIESLGENLNEITPINSGWAGSNFASPFDFKAQVGHPVGEMYGYVTDGFYTADDFEGYDPATNLWIPVKGLLPAGTPVGQVAQPGVIKLRDLNKDGVVNDQDQQVIGNANPKVTGGLNQQFTYKNFDASIFLNFVLGNDIYNANKIEFTTNTPNTIFSNVLGVMEDRFRTINADGTRITDLNTLRQVNKDAKIWTPTQRYFLHSWAVEDGSFLRINNLTVGYSLPKPLIQRVKMTQVRFYVTLNNLYTFTKYTGYDPEVNTRRSSPLTPGVDYAAYPRSRTFLFGVNLAL